MNNFRYKKCFASTVLISLCLLSVSCNAKKSDFPEIPAPTSESAEVTEETSTEAEKEKEVLTVALPYTSETVDYLYKLYSAKKAGYWDESLSGATVDKSYLDSMQTDIAIENIYVPNEGVSPDTIKSWGDEQPDIFLTNDLVSTIDEGLCTSLDEYLCDNQLLNTDNVYLSSLKSLIKGGELYALPYYSTVPLIYGNKDLAPGGEVPDFRCSLDKFDRYVKSIDPQEGEIVVFAKGYQLIPYICSAFDDEKALSSYMLREEYLSKMDRTSGIFERTVDYINGLYNNGITANSTPDGTDPVHSRNCAMWIAQSSDIELWDSYYPNKLYFMQVPVYKDSDEAVPYLTLFPICVSEKSADKALASDFAAFLALDEDAIMLADRFEHKPGFLPLISSSEAWDQIISDINFGYIASVYELHMNEAKYSCEVLDDKLYDKIEMELFNGFNSDEPGEVTLENIYG